MTAEVERTGRGIPSPWLHRDPWPEGQQHDPATCQVCCPYVDTEPYRRGVELARQAEP